MKKVLIILLIIVTVPISLVFIYGKITIGNTENTKKFVESNFYNEYYKTDKLLLVNVWSTTCKPCIEEFKDFEKIKSDENFSFISLSIDNDSLRLKKFLEKNLVVKNRDITLKNFSVRDSIYSALELSGSNTDLGFIKFNSKIIPFTVLIKEKKILYKANDDIDFEKLKKLIDENK